MIVADGFTGNVALKVMEGASAALLGAVRTAAMSSLRSKLGGLLLAARAARAAVRTRPEEQGGAVLLGLRRLAVVPHGSFAAAASRGRSRSPPAACARTWRGARTRGSRRRGRCGAASEAAASVPDES